LALDRIAREVVDAMSAQFPDLGGQVTDAPTARAMLDAAPRPQAGDLPLYAVEDRQIDRPGAAPVPVRVYRPHHHGPSPAIVFFHGGGFVLSSVDGHDAFARKLAVGTDSVVISVEYRLAPENRYPAAVEDAVVATAWVTDNADALGIDSARIAVAGDSAGGNLAAVVCLIARDRGGPPLAAQMLIYPVLDARQDSDSYRRNATGYFLTATHMRWFWEQYLGGADPDDPHVSPIRAADVSGLPPAVIVVGEHDVLGDDGRRYAALLSGAGVSVELLDYPGMFHGFFGLTAQLPTAQRANHDAFTAVKRLLSTTVAGAQGNSS
jgi:acetyl esterase